MRVTNRMMTNTALNNMNNNLTRLNKLNEQMSSGKNVSRPSDDPIATARILSFKTIQSNQEQYDRNMDDAISWLDTTDGALMNVNDVIQRVKELNIYGANTGVLPPEAREAIAEEIDGMIGEMIQIGNTSLGGRYIFAGAHTTEPPFEIVKEEDGGKLMGIKFLEKEFKNADTGFTPPAGFDSDKLDSIFKLEYEVEAGVTMNVSLGKASFFQASKDEDGNEELSSIFNEMISLRDNLIAGNTEELNKSLGTFDKLHDNVLSELSSVGAMTKRMESAQSRSKDFQLNLKNMLSKIEDIDYAGKSIEVKSQQATYEAALMTTAKAIQPSLLQFLR